MYLYFALSSLFNAVTSTLLGLFVFFKDRRNVVNQTFAFFCLAVAAWSYPYVFWPLAKTREGTLLSFQLLHIGASFCSITYLHFVASWLGLTKKRAMKITIAIGYVLAVFFASFVFSPYFISDMVPKFSMRFWATPGLLYHYYLVFFFGYAIYSSYLLIKHYNKVTGVKRSQMKYIFAGMVLSFAGGSTNYLLWYNINFPPFCNILASSYVILSAYAIVAHRLMDIKLALRRSFVYISSVLAIVIPASAILYLTDFYFPKYLILISLAVLVLAVSVFSPTRDYYYRIANKYFFSSLYDVREVITKLSDGLRSTLDVTEVYNFISRTLIGTFHTKAVGVLNYDAVSGQYAVQFNSGFLLGDRKIFSGDKILQEEYIKKSKIVVVEEIKSVAYERHKEMIDTLMGLGAAVVVPLNIKDEMLGVMVLGNKESGDMFNDEDLRTLETVASQAAIAIKNAQLYGETRGFSVTLQKEVERQTKQLKEANVELQKLDKAKSDFISIASHQLRTPLTAIKGFTSMILEGSYGRVTNVVRDKLEKIFESTERLVRLVNDLLDLSHMEGGGMEYNFAKVDFDAMVRSVVEELTPPAEKKKLKFKWRTPDENIWVWADEQKLRQVVMNLIDNAIKYTPQGAVDVILERVDGNVQMSVKDTGMGMKKSELANLFQKFVRGTEAPRYYTEGAGIGLYVAKQLIEAQKGEVWAESPGEDKGSTFFVKMPEMKGGTS
ncbi:MAG TPA: hypothetical protein DHI91_01185 [Candidatus Portnoybacteria bacterium]|nr:hypothetical protein [Candidatus Portnoybacteria bacterium]